MFTDRGVLRQPDATLRSHASREELSDDRIGGVARMAQLHAARAQGAKRTMNGKQSYDDHDGTYRLRS